MRSCTLFSGIIGLSSTASRHSLLCSFFHSVNLLLGARSMQGLCESPGMQNWKKRKIKKVFLSRNSGFRGDRLKILIYSSVAESCVIEGHLKHSREPGTASWRNHLLRQELEHFSCKGPGNKYIRLCCPVVSLASTQCCSYK